MEKDIFAPYSDEIENKIGKIFSIFTRNDADTEQAYTKAVIDSLFKEIGQPVPEIINRAQEILSRFIPSIDYGSDTDSKLMTAMDRCDLMLELVGISHGLGVLHEAWESLIDQLEEVFWPDKSAGTEADRKIILKARMANYKAISNIIHYLFAHCGKIVPGIHQSVLSFERAAITSQ